METFWYWQQFEERYTTGWKEQEEGRARKEK